MRNYNYFATVLPKYGGGGKHVQGALMYAKNYGTVYVHFIMPEITVQYIYIYIG